MGKKGLGVGGNAQEKPFSLHFLSLILNPVLTWFLFFTCKSLCFLTVLFVNIFLNFYFFFGLDLDRFVLGRTFCHTK
jgi:hypothetical protein